MIESFRRVPVAAALVVFTSIATVYWVLLGSSSLPRKRVRGPRGLANYGKNCYLNAVLQALASSSIIESWLSKSSSPLQQSLLKCLKVLNRQEDDPSEEVSPTYLFSALRSQGFVITGDEQDAHELFQGLWDAIESDQAQVATAMESDPLKLADETEEGAVGILRRLGKSSTLTATSPDDYSSPFCGTMTCRVENQAPESQSSPTRSTFFNNVTLYLPPRENQILVMNSTISLEFLLQTLVNVEHVESSTKQQSFARLPKCLCLHIQRTGFQSGIAFKRDDKVVFPLCLNMDRFIYSQQLYQRRTSSKLTRSVTIDQESVNLQFRQQVDENSQRNSYGLCAVITHLGGIESGHYITFRKYTIGGRVRWYVTSDGDVRQVNIEQVLSANPYLLIYEKMSSPPHSTFSPSSSSSSPPPPPPPPTSQRPPMSQKKKSCEQH